MIGVWFYLFVCLFVCFVSFIWLLLIDGGWLEAVGSLSDDCSYNCDC